MAIKMLEWPIFFLYINSTVCYTIYMNKETFTVDYMIRNLGMAGAGGRMQLQGSSLQHLNSAKSDFAVLEYLKRMNPSKQIDIMSIRWS